MNISTQCLSGKDAATEAARLLSKDECVAIPTETVYGLAAKADSREAVAKIFAAKNRPADHPLILHLAKAADARTWARDIPSDFYKLADAFWPGPLTIVLKKSPQVSDAVTAGLDSVAIRVPSHPLFLEILEILGTALVARSANMHKELSAVCAEQVLSSMSGRISAVVDGGRCSVGVESTILDMTGDRASILRAGPITRDQLEGVLGKSVLQPTKHTVKVSGNMKAHYQPKATLRIVSREDLKGFDVKQIAKHDVFLIQSQETLERIRGMTEGLAEMYEMPADARDYARDLYYTLAKADRGGARRIFVEQPPETDEWLAVNDRLIRAQG